MTQQPSSAILDAAAIAPIVRPHLRLLVPVKRDADVDNAIPYLLSLAPKAGIRVIFLHVNGGDGALPAADSERLFALAARACARYGIEHEALLADGEVAFAILDTAESLACDQIVLPRGSGSGGWRQLFTTPVVRQLQALGRDVPLVLIGAAGNPVEQEQP